MYHLSMRNFGNNLLEAWHFFRKKKVSILASASSFYVMLSLIPLSLLLVRVLGMFLGDVEDTRVKLFKLGNALFPDADAQILTTLEKIVEGPLYGSAPFTYLNFFFLAFASLSFFNSIWTGLAIITKDESKNLWVRLKGLSIIAGTMVLLMLIILIPAFLRFMEGLVKDNFVSSTIKEYFPQTTDFFNYVAGMDFGVNFILSTNLIPFVLFLVYFTILYRWLFHWKIKLFHAFLGSFIFVSALIIGKNLFYWYFYFARETLKKNYGDYYTFIVAMIWLFIVMCFFFYGACLCHIYDTKKEE